MTRIPDDHPLMIAWKAHQKTEEFANSMKWAVTGQQYIQGSMWAVFTAGFDAALNSKEKE